MALIWRAANPPDPSGQKARDLRDLALSTPDPGLASALIPALAGHAVALGLTPDDVADLEATTPRLLKPRLSAALAEAREWPSWVFRALFASRPRVVANISGELVWECIGTGTFRPTATGFEDANGAHFALGADDRIRLVHPARLSPSERLGWQVKIDAAPIDQLNLPVHPQQPDALGAAALNAGEIPALPFLRRLEAHDWKRVSVEDGGVTIEHSRRFGTRTMVIRYQAMSVRKTWMKPEDKTRVLGLDVMSHGKRQAAEELDPGVFSSIMAHLLEILRP